MLASLDARYSYAGCYSGWLWKVKHEGAKAKWLGSSVRRYFTIDFNYKAFAYAHSDDASATVSTCIQFRDILGASLPRESWALQVPQGGLRRSLSAACTRSQAERIENEHPFTVHTRSRKFKLVAETAEDAAAWVAGLNAAHLVGIGREAELHVSAELSKPKRCSESGENHSNPPDRQPLSPSSSLSTAETTSEPSREASGVSTTSSDAEIEPVPSAAETTAETEACQHEKHIGAGSNDVTNCSGQDQPGKCAWTDAQTTSATIALTADVKDISVDMKPVQEGSARALRAADFGFDEDAQHCDGLSPVPSPVGTPRGLTQVTVPPQIGCESCEKSMASSTRASPCSQAQVSAGRETTRCGTSACSNRLPNAEVSAASIDESGIGSSGTSTGSAPSAPQRRRSEKDEAQCEADQSCDEDGSKDESIRKARIAADMGLLQPHTAYRQSSKMKFDGRAAAEFDNEARIAADVSLTSRQKQERKLRKSSSDVIAKADLGLKREIGLSKRTTEEDTQASRVAADLALLQNHMMKARARACGLAR